MYRQAYTLDELRFAYAYRIYARWHTHRWQPNDALAQLDRRELQHLVRRHGIRVMRARGEPREAVVLLSLAPTDTVSAAVGKVKGCVSKWLRARTPEAGRKLLGEGYFSCTAGDSTRVKVEAYLSKQGRHHGYTGVYTIPPVYEEKTATDEDDEARLHPTRARTLLRFHVVLVTSSRKGVFGRESGPVVTNAWRALEGDGRFLLEKVSFVPDHVHLAVRAHPLARPADLAVALLNRAEEVMHREFPEHLIQAGVERLWQRGAYIGAYGDVTSDVVQTYIRGWRGRGR